jgi:hypothetical protein
MWIAAALAVIVVLTATAWLGDDPPEHRRFEPRAH